jgi:NAD(P)-dependent dehydrogenase (short-subunit alcohol dehydrogenase family)
MKQNIIVTGGAQGIGKVVTQKLVENGYSVSVFEIDREALDECQTENASSDIAYLQTDISDEKNVQKSINASLEKFRNIRGLINNAAIHANKPIVDLSLQEWNSVIATNLTGAFLCTKFVTPHLKKQNGSIINICSTRAFQSEPDTEAYSASKGGIFSLTHALAMSLGPEIRVNSISPGWIDVSGVKKKSAANQLELREIDHNQHPAGRVGNAEDIASVILFLLNPNNSFITGQNFIVDGGMTRKMIYE